jgi:hypothetical protein
VYSLLGVYDDMSGVGFEGGLSWDE